MRLARRLERRVDDRHSTIDLPCDLTKTDQVERVVATVRQTLGVPEIVVNNAGAFLLKPFVETSTAELRAQLEANLVGAFNLLRALAPAMAAAGGHVVTIGSIADHAALPGNAAYAASKFALRGLHDTLKAELGPAGLRLTLISPGATDTELWDPLDPDGRDDLPDRANMLRPQDVAEAVHFAVTRPRHVQVELIRLGAT